MQQVRRNQGTLPRDSTGSPSLSRNFSTAHELSPQHCGPEWVIQLFVFPDLMIFMSFTLSTFSPHSSVTVFASFLSSQRKEEGSFDLRPSSAAAMAPEKTLLQLLRSRTIVDCDTMDVEGMRVLCLHERVLLTWPRSPKSSRSVRWLHFEPSMSFQPFLHLTRNR